MIVVISLLFGGFLTVVSAQRETVFVEGIVNDVIKPNDGLFSNIVEQFGIVSFSPTPSATTSVTPSVSSSASMSPAASASASFSPLASNSALPSQLPSPTPSSSASPSSSVSPTPSTRGRRSSTQTAPSPPTPSATSSSTPSPADPCMDTITLPASGYDNLGFLFQDGEGGLTLDIDSAVEFGDLLAGYSCGTNDPNMYLSREQSDDRETITVAIKRALDDGFLDTPKVVKLRAGWYYGTDTEAVEDVRETISIATYTFNGNLEDLAEESATSVQTLSILPCCTDVGPLGYEECATMPVATVQISKNADDSITLSATQINSQPC